MIAPILRRRHIHAHRPIALAQPPLVVLAGLPCAAHADRGRRTPTANWAQQHHEHCSVHMMLLRGGSNPLSLAHPVMAWGDLDPGETTPMAEGSSLTGTTRSLRTTAEVPNAPRSMDFMGDMKTGGGPACRESSQCVRGSSWLEWGDRRRNAGRMV